VPDGELIESGFQYQPGSRAKLKSPCSSALVSQTSGVIRSWFSGSPKNA
jgi:hypothetical protein